MPKIFGRNLSPLTIVGLGAAATYLGFNALFPEDAPIKRPPAKRNKLKVSTKAVAFQPEDYTMRFATYSEPVKNTFKPLIVRRDVSKLATPGGLSPAFTGGGQWVYSGRMVVNGVTQGLLEDHATGDSEFVLRGQRWKRSTVLEIGEDSISLAGPDGERVTLIAGASEPAPRNNVTAPGAVAPVTVGPGLMGQLGVQPVPEASPNERRQRRPRRNRDMQGMEE